MDDVPKDPTSSEAREEASRDPAVSAAFYQISLDDKEKIEEEGIDSCQRDQMKYIEGLLVQSLTMKRALEDLIETIEATVENSNEGARTSKLDDAVIKAVLVLIKIDIEAQRTTPGIDNQEGTNTRTIEISDIEVILAPQENYRNRTDQRIPPHKNN